MVTLDFGAGLFRHEATVDYDGVECCDHVVRQVGAAWLCPPGNTTIVSGSWKRKCTEVHGGLAASLSSDGATPIVPMQSVTPPRTSIRGRHTVHRS
ncbi:hypothetical protein CTI12_AA139830 [Artemisia annua]|uniref:Uncharacterized protein n=1 Tax=Artemisia annua TaxID=35608 RepID=A0A2U1PL87_ARTAN|nr:hypothetical protein CTI12_AA139830 [Artemisia annua]